MSEDRIEKITERLAWLAMELTHANYHPGRVAKGFEEERKRLLKELEEIKKRK